MLSIAYKNPSDIDQEIIRLIQVNESREQGFRLMISTYQRRLYAHIRNLVVSHEDTDDVLQNVFLKICKHIHQFEQKSTLFTWMYTIATRESFDFLAQKRKKSFFAGSKEIQNAAISGSDSLDAHTINQALQQAIQALPEKQRLVFHMRYYDELTYEQISDITGTSVGALKASYHHAIKKLEQIIVENYGH